MTLQEKIIAGLSIALIIAIMLIGHSCDNTKVQENLNSAIQDSLHQERDEKGRQTTTIEAYVSSVRLLKDELHSEKETNKRLLATISKFGNKVVSIASIDIVTKNNSSGTTTVVPKDTVNKAGIMYVYPVYFDTIVKPWSSYMVRADKDSTHITSITKQAIDVSFIEFKKYHLFKKDSSERRSNLQIFLDPPKINLRVNLQNPDSGVTDAHGFVKEGKKKYTGLKILAGALSLEALRIGLTGKP